MRKPLSQPRPWTLQEVEFLVGNYPQSDPDLIAACLQRTSLQVRQKIMQLKLKSYQ